MNAPPTKSKNTLKAGLFFISVIIAGLLLAFGVNHTLQQAKSDTFTLVDQKLPALAHIKAASALLIEQERLLYEYYAKDENPLYQRLHSASMTQLQLEFAMLPPHPNFAHSNALENALTHIDSLAKALKKNLAANPTDWDTARTQLATLTETRESMAILLNQLANLVSQDVNAGYRQARQALNQTVAIVAGFSLVLILVCVVMGRYVIKYLAKAQETERLALFPIRNPHPIISLDHTLKPLFINPAAERLLTQQQANISDLLPDALITQLASHTDTHIALAFQCYETSLKANAFWLEDVAQWDVHYRDVSKEEAAKRAVTYQAEHNAITSCPNLHVLMRTLNTPQAGPLTLILCELTQHSHVLSRHGINASHALQKAAFDTLTQALKTNASQAALSQMSDSTFAITLSSDAHIESLIAKLAKALVAQSPYSQGEALSTCCFGVARYPADTQTTEDLLRFARIALDANLAKRDALFTAFQPELAAALEYKATLTEQLAHAIKHELLTLHWQPQKDIQSGTIVGAETLCRWQHQGKMISPAEFIPLAEETGLIIPLGKWILAQSCNLLAALSSSHPELVIAVNISPQQFNHPDFYHWVEEALNARYLNPARLELEITEGVLMQEGTEPVALLNKLKSLGVQLSIDDFGTGYSSLAYLSRFAIDKLKIDQSFVRKLFDSEKDLAIVNSTIALGKALSLTIIAEGVEDNATEAALAHAGCDEIQGFGFAKPMPYDAFMRFINTQNA